LDAFTKEMKSARYPSYKDMSHPLETGAYGVVRRYYRAPEKPFPLMQIGPGIFASNEGPTYEWRQFRMQVLRGVSALLKSYPNLNFFTLRPIQVELRYVDIFDSALLGKTALFDFTQHGTSLNFKLPPMLNDRSVFSGDPAGRFQFGRTLRGWDNTRFTLDLISGVRETDKLAVVRMETMVVSKETGVPVLKGATRFLGQLEKWLDFAHGVTSPFFKQFILPEVMKKFKGS